jgi:hypothetical protein
MLAPSSASIALRSPLNKENTDDLEQGENADNADDEDSASIMNRSLDMSSSSADHIELQTMTVKDSLSSSSIDYDDEESVGQQLYGRLQDDAQHSSSASS